MNKQELKVAIVALALIVGAGIFLSQRKNTLGRPGLVVESQSITNEHGVKVADRRIALPSGLPGYRDQLLPITDLEIKVLPKDTTFGRRLYEVSTNASVQVSAILMGSDRTSIHKPYYCITGQGWRIDKAEVIKIPMSRPEPYQLEAQLLTTTASYKNPEGKILHAKGLFMYWYVAESELTPHHKEQMWFLARDLLSSGVLQRWAYISCFSMCAPGEEKIRLEQMKRLAAETVPAFQIPPGKAPAQTAMLDRTGPLQ